MTTTAKTDDDDNDKKTAIAQPSELKDGTSAIAAKPQ